MPTLLARQDLNRKTAEVVDHKFDEDREIFSYKFQSDGHHLWMSESDEMPDWMETLIDLYHATRFFGNRLAIA